MSSLFSFLSPRTQETVQKDIEDTTTKLAKLNDEYKKLSTPESTPAPPAQLGGRRRRTQKGKKSKKNKSRKSKR
jgi:hypothetical protein